MSSDSNAAVEPPVAVSPPSAIYFDGVTNRRHIVELKLGTALEISENGVSITSWRFDDLRLADGGQGVLRLKCVGSLPLARLEVRDTATQAEIRAQARFLGAEQGGGRETFRIVGWSLAAIVSIALIAVFGVPRVADRLAPLISFSFERHLGDMADNQVKAIFGGKVCTSPEGTAAFAKLVETLRQAGHLDRPLQTEVLASKIPNAFALPGGKIYLLDGLLQKAESPDEIAGIIAHEMGHVSHRDQMRMLIERGGTAFLIGLLFGDVTGSTAAIVATQTLLRASYSRKAEGNADAFAVDTMHALGRSPAPMGELLFRITGAQGSKTIGVLASHPLTEERRELMRREDRPVTGPEILSAAEWNALKNVCHSTGAN
jgi:Zn-dependent protease with chaperone function